MNGLWKIGPQLLRCPPTRINAPMSSLDQFVGSAWYDAGDVGYLRSDDLSGNGNYALQDKDFSVVSAGIADRSIGTDYTGARVELTTDPCLHLDEWFLSFSVKAQGSGDRRFYAEARTGEDVCILGIGTISTVSDSIKIVFRDANNNIFVDLTYPGVFDDTTHNVDLELRQEIGSTFGRIYIQIDDGGWDLVGERTGAYTGNTPNNSVIGALVRSSVSSDFIGNLWDFKKCDQPLIPINEGSGTTIKDETGATVGTLIDPSGTFWDNGIAKKIILNNTAFAGPAGYPADGVELTRAELATLHNGTDIFTPTTDYNFIFATGTGLTAQQQLILNNLMGR